MARLRISLALVLAALAPTGSAAEGASGPLPQSRTYTASHLLPAIQRPVDCGAGAARAARALEAVARTGRLDHEQHAWLQALVTGDEALRHADLATLALAVAFEQDFPLEGVTAARRDALLDVLMAPAIPRSACLPADALVRLRARLLVTCCAELHAGAVPVAEWAQAPARPFLLLVERLGPTIPETCRRVLRRELGDASEIQLGTPPRPDDAPPDGLGSALVPPPVEQAGRAAGPPPAR